MAISNDFPIETPIAIFPFISQSAVTARGDCMKVLDLPQDVKERRMFGFFDDFEWYISPHRWSSLAADAGASVAIGASAAGGTVVLTTGATDNNEAAVATTNSSFRIADDKPLLFETRLQFSEANVDDANV